MQDAINEAPAINRALKPYKLMTVSALAELYVLWREGKGVPGTSGGSSLGRRHLLGYGTRCTIGLLRRQCSDD